MYDVKPNLIIGFHGCEREIRDALLMNPNEYIDQSKVIRLVRAWFIFLGKQL